MRRATFTLCLLATAASWAWPAFSQIVVTTATYGSNVAGVPPGNATAKVAAQCNGTASCAYVVWYYNFVPDPAPQKPKAFSVSWTCAGVPFQTVAAPTQPNGEAGYGAVATLSCGATPTPTPIPPTPTPTPPGPTPTPGPWPTPDPKKWTVLIWCVNGEPQCAPGGWIGFNQYSYPVHVQLVTPVGQ